MLYYLRLHIIAFCIGFLLDLVIGDPRWFYHPVRLIGKLIEKLSGLFLDGKKELVNITKRRRGFALVVIVLLVTTVVVSIITIGSYLISPTFGCVVESFLSCTIFATRSLEKESRKVYLALKTGTLEEARTAVSMIVGRDTACLDEVGVTKAAVETIAENASDGVIAPLLMTAIGGPILGYFYKAINTMDSMVGYKNDRYLDFGRAAAKLDDVANFMPARFSAGMMILAAGSISMEAMRNAKRIFLRDRYHHASPNSAQTESVMAGALGIELAGPASYFGKVVEKPTIGDAQRPVEMEDICRANALMLRAAVFSWIFLLFLLGLALLLCGH